MSIISAIILGLVQGLTEFIPVSSSGHLVLTQRFLGVNSFTFDVLLNFGTLLALVVFYRKRIWQIVTDIIVKRRIELAAKLLAATIPTVCVGLLLADSIEKFNENVILVCIMLALVGALMIWFGHERDDAAIGKINHVSWRSTAVIALAQACALIPGTSRSGITILAGLREKLSAKAAAEFSFMLAIPTILGASLKTLVSHEGRAFVVHHPLPVLVGNIVSFAAGMVAIRFLIDLLSRKGLRAFGFYRIGLASVLAVLLLFKVI